MASAAKQIAVLAAGRSQHAACNAFGKTVMPYTGASEPNR